MTQPPPGWGGSGQEPPPGSGPPPPPPGWGPPPPGWGPPPPGWGPPPGYPHPGYGYGYGPQTEGKATGALAAAIMSFFACPVVLAIVALVLADQARKDIRSSGGRLTGEGLVTAANVIAWINLAIAGAFAIFLLLALATAAG